VSELRGELVGLEAEISSLRCRQHVVVNELDKVNAAAGDGYRSSVDWLSALLDVERSTAADLVYAARWSTKHRRVEGLWAEGLIGFDRTVAMLRLAAAGADTGVVDESRGLDLAGVNRLAGWQRRVTRRDERAVFVGRFVSIQPTLDEVSWHLTGRLPAVDGEIIEQALYARADELRILPGGETCTRVQRHADSLVAMAQDSLDRHSSDGEASSGSSVSIFVDLGEANGTGGEHGAMVAYGPRVGPATLEELLCTGSVQIIGLADGRPVVTSTASRAIPGAVRRFVAHRDGGCVIAGCTSRYRLQPHHIVHRADGGSHDPDNLATLCWFHHHIAIHHNGLTIDPDTPPRRRRLIRKATGTDPPEQDMRHET
jgi:hypothetical protein